MSGFRSPKGAPLSGAEPLARPSMFARGSSEGASLSERGASDGAIRPPGGAGQRSARRAVLAAAALLLAAAALLLAAPAAAQGDRVAAQGDRAASRSEEPSEESPTPAQIEAALYRYRHEPTVARVVEAALEHRTASPSVVHDAIARARGAGWLPRARLSIRRGQAVDLRGLSPDGAVETANISTDDDLTFQASMTFDLDRIVFSSSETSLLRELRTTERERAELSRWVVSVYFERRRLQLERDLIGGGSDLARAVRILEAEALLDAFTGGAFTRMMGARRPGSAGRTRDDP